MSLNRVAARGVAALRILAVAVLAGGALTACTSVSPTPMRLNVASTRTAAGASDYASPAASSSTSPRASRDRRYKVGAPYQAGGVWYVPAEQRDYDEVGLASWYGDDFNGKPTANGELFDMDGVSAAHATLPMPSIVEVTNLENGHSIQVRLNDRGPFHPGRIIDLSRGAAKQLGFYEKGTAKVRVRFISAAPLVDGASMAGNLVQNPMQSVLSPSGPDQARRYQSSFKPPFAADGSAFMIQAGAFSDRANAERVALRLASTGRTEIKTVDRNGSRLYRVMVGSWKNQQDAGDARERVASLGFSQAMVVAGG